MAQNGVLAMLDRPYEGRKHNSGMLADSWLTKLNGFSCDKQNQPPGVYGNLAYPLRVHLDGPFKNSPTGPTPEQISCKGGMAQVRIYMEWVFQDIQKCFDSLDFKKKIKNWT